MFPGLDLYHAAHFRNTMAEIFSRAFHGSWGFQSLAGRVGSGRVGSGRVGSGLELFKSRTSGRVGTRGLQISRVGLGQEVLKTRVSGGVGSKGVEISRVRTDRVMIRDLGVTRGSSHHIPRVVFCYPRTEPADLACGFAFFKLTAACQRALVVPAPAGRTRGSDPWVRK